MTTAEENQLLVHTGPGTPGGAMMRRYWHPVALSTELPPGGAPLPIRILSEDLVLFRDEAGAPGLLQRHCPHRCADLSYGRLEDGGLRCLYHGWLFDVAGNCLEQPGEPPESTYKDEVKAVSYPCKEVAGMIFTYLGGGKAPEMPDYEFFRADEAHRFLHRSDLECNYLQSLEGNIDPVHLSYLHRPHKRADARAVPGSDDKSADMYYAEDRAPRLDLEATDYGIRIFSVRSSGPDKQYVRVTNFLMPNFAAIVGQEGRVNEGYSVHWHVPIDDSHNMRFDFTFNRVRPMDIEKYESRETNYLGLDGKEERRQKNRYFQDREAMVTENFNGMGRSFNVHDAYASESQGDIHDRTRENLATSDRIIVQARRQLLEAINAVEEGKEPRGVIRDPNKRDLSELVVMSEVTTNTTDHREVWKAKVAQQTAAE